MMFNAFERMVAFRYLRPTRKEGFISIIAIFSFLGILLGVAALIIVMSVMNGFRQELVSRVLGLNGHLTVYGTAGPIRNYEPLRERIAGLEGVVDVMPVIEGQALVTHGGDAGGAAVRGVLPEDFLRRPSIAQSIELRSPDAFSGTEVIAIGARMAARYGLRIGDKLSLFVPQGNAGPFGTVPRGRAYTIVGIFEVGMYEYDNGFVYMPIEAAQILYRLQQSVTGLDVFIHDPDRLAQARARIEPVLDGEARLWDWQQANSSFFTALQVERNVMFLILTLIILVAAFNVISGLVMLVKDKGRDIAILRTMGARRSAVMRIFLLTGASIGVAGTIAGAMLGIAFVINIETIRGWMESLTGTELFPAEIYFLSQLPAVIDWNEAGLVIAIAIGLSFLATLYPSWRAARLDPVEALRYE